MEVTSEQTLIMSDQASFLFPTKNSCSTFSPFLNPPRIFNGFISKNVLDAESVSPTSILDSRNSNLSNQFGRTPCPVITKSEREAIGLALIDSIIDEKFDCRISRPINLTALFRSKLKFRIPEANDSPGESTQSPAKEFGRQLSLKEMETSEDYTCVITHGPNQKTTHIYHDCIVDSSFSDDDKRKIETQTETEPSNFLSFCHTCKAVLGEDKDIFMYRGEKAFCSQECRCREMIFQGVA